MVSMIVIIFHYHYHIKVYPRSIPFHSIPFHIIFKYLLLIFILKFVFISQDMFLVVVFFVMFNLRFEYISMFIMSYSWLLWLCSCPAQSPTQYTILMVIILVITLFDRPHFHDRDFSRFLFKFVARNVWQTQPKNWTYDLSSRLLIFFAPLFSYFLLDALNIVGLGCCQTCWPLNWLLWHHRCPHLPLLRVPCLQPLFFRFIQVVSNATPRRPQSKLHRSFGLCDFSGGARAIQYRILNA